MPSMYRVHIDNSHISWIRFAFSVGSFFSTAARITFEKYSRSYMKSIRFAQNGQQLTPIEMPHTSSPAAGINCLVSSSPNPFPTRVRRLSCTVNRRVFPWMLTISVPVFDAQEAPFRLFVWRSTVLSHSTYVLKDEIHVRSHFLLHFFEIKCGVHRKRSPMFVARRAESL